MKINEIMDFHKDKDVVKRAPLSIYHLKGHDHDDDNEEYVVVTKSGKIVSSPKSKENALKTSKSPILINKYGDLSVKKKSVNEIMDFNKGNDVVKRHAMSTYHLDDSDDDRAEYVVVTQSGKVISSPKSKDDAKQSAKSPVLTKKYGALSIRKA